MTDATMAPAHKAHLDPSTYERDEEGGGATGVCAVCNNLVLLPAGTEPNPWIYSKSDWALSPMAPWVHSEGEGQVTPFGEPLRYHLAENAVSIPGRITRQGVEATLSVPIPEEKVHEVEIARFASITGGPVGIESRTVSVAAASVEDARYLALVNNPGWLLVQDSVLSGDAVELEATPVYDQPNIVSVSDDDTEHPREDPYAAPAADDTTKGGE